MINFVKFSKITLIFSIIFSLMSIFCIIKYKFNLGLEFTGGLELEIISDNDILIDDIRIKLKNLDNLKLKYYGSKKTIQLKIKSSEKDFNKLIVLVKNSIPENMKIIKSDFIGEEINNETIKNTILSIIIAFMSMFLYLTLRFEYKMALSAIVTLFHDIILTLGLISFLALEFDLIVLSSVFTIFGYSINDTVIIFDRIRETKNIFRKNFNLSDVINISINKTLSRTLITSLSTLFVTLVLAIFSGTYLFNFYIILSFGIIVGTYSSIYISAMPLLFLNNNSSKQIVTKNNIEESLDS